MFTEESTKRYPNDHEYDKEFILSQTATEQCKIIRLREVKSSPKYCDDYYTQKMVDVLSRV